MGLIRAVPADEKRAKVCALRERGLSYDEIARRLKLPKATVAFHARAGASPVSPKAARRYDWKAINACVQAERLSMRAAMERFGFCRDTWAKAVARGAVVPVDRTQPLDELLRLGSAVDRGQLKRRLLLAGLKSEACEGCGISCWQGRALALQLHHVNGDGRDNRLENLQLLCPNCHSQTDTFAGRNKRGRARGGASPEASG